MSGMERLFNSDARQNMMFAVIEALNHDLKQRLFMHQDKLKDIQTILLRKNLNFNEVRNFSFRNLIFFFDCEF